jgi:hypothetical protein
MSDDETDFPDVVAAEKEYIEAWRSKNGRVGREQLSGLALSGGGIRSAVFCLGVLQALTKYDVLKNFDYLSTVSGGGYIGSSLTWFTRSSAPFSVRPDKFPYGIDDPMQQQPKKCPGSLLLKHLRRHGSYLDPGGTVSLLAGIAIVLRGLVLNLLVIWLPLVTVFFVALRIADRWLAQAAAYDGKAWLTPFALSLLAGTVFTAAAILYSLTSGLSAKTHRDMPYAIRQAFERVTPYILVALALLLIFGSLPYLRAFIILKTALPEGIPGFILTAAGAIMGVWSRLVPRGLAAAKVPTWAGPVGAGLVLYGMGLAGYELSHILFGSEKGFPDHRSLAMTVLLAVSSVFIGYFVDLNETTLHRFYRDRLMEAFMPDIDAKCAPIGRRAKVADSGRLRDMCDQSNPHGPYHLICAHLVITHVGQRDGGSKAWRDRWRNRGGDSFLFSPRFCGANATGWHATATNKTLSALSLPTVMAASGAAVNPDAAGAGVGPQRNMLFAVLMALLNMRLGIWLPNPRRYGKRKHAPAPNHFTAGVTGVLDRASRTSRFLEITDGGHFENLGVYELLRRGVKTVVVCDATADPKSAFEDLQNLLSRSEADFGVSIEFCPPPLGPLMPSTANARFPLGVAFAQQPFVIGKIRYPDDPVCGKFYYIKPTIFSDLRLNLLGFKGAFPAFPDDSTADQFFDEGRFEAYRELGFACIEKMLSEQTTLKELTDM